MLRHVIAPARSFAQIPNAILRHPRLSSDAKNLLNWQLSLPSGQKQCLSDTARAAGIGKCAFTKAKRQLLDEGFLHQWTVQRDGGRFATVQLISNTPLSAKEALAVRDGLRPAPGGAGRSERVSDDGPPSVHQPAAGEPTGRAVGRQPEKNTWENTTQPSGPVRESEDEPPEAAAADGSVGGLGAAEEGSQQAGSTGLAAAEALLLSMGRLDPQFAIPARTARSWAPLAAKWLESGLSPLRARQLLTEGLETARKPLGALRWRLEHALPEVPPSPVADAAAPKPEPRTSRMRECRTLHTQPRLFMPPPGSDEELCPDCRTHAAQAPTPPPSAERSGYAAFVEARQVTSSASPEARLRQAGQRRQP